MAFVLHNETSALGCGAFTICGAVTAKENATPQYLPDILVELRDQWGQVQKSTTTTAVGPQNYDFTGLTATKLYFVDPVVGRTQYVIPQQKSVLLNSAGNPSIPTADFSVGGVVATLTVSNESPGTLVLITPAPWTQPQPPDVSQSASSTTNSYSKTVGRDGKTIFSVPPNFHYYISCWKPSGTGANTIFTPHLSGTIPIAGGSGTGGLFMPNDPGRPSCP